MIIRKDELRPAAWSGGETTQLAIYPAGASYADRNFLWRVSTATVDVEKSEFTPLPEVSRILMILEGEMRLVHDSSQTIALRRFEQDSFSGGTHTISIGRARDFNLMIKEGCTGTIEALELLPGAHKLHTAEGVFDSGSFSVTDTPADEVFYAITDVRIGGMDLAAGDVYIRNGGGDIDIGLFDNGPAIIIKATIIH